MQSWLKKAKQILNFFLKHLIILLFFPFYLLVKLMEPFLLLRICLVDPSRIGLMLNVDFCLKEKLLRKNKKNIGVFIFNECSTKYSNKQWIKMWTSAVSFTRFPKFWIRIVAILRYYPFSKKNLVEYPSKIDDLPETSILNKVNLKFTDEEENLGVSNLKKIGLASKDKFVCFHSRDEAFLKHFSPNRNWDYHSFRNSDIQNYLEAINFLTKNNLFAFRMGVKVEKELKTDNPKIIDFHKSKIKSDFMDIYLGSRCFFYISSESGISTIPEVFQKPIVYANIPSLTAMQLFANNSLIIFKKLYDCRKRKLVPFKEQMDIISGNYNHSSDYYKKKNIKILDNTSEEISEVTEEMYKRLIGTWETNKEDLELQDAFWKIINPKVKSETFYIGANYLRKYKDLLN